MAEVRINPETDELGDVEMQAGEDDVVEVGETGADPADGGAGDDLAEGETANPARVTFVEWVAAHRAMGMKDANLWIAISNHRSWN